MAQAAPAVDVELVKIVPHLFQLLLNGLSSEDPWKKEVKDNILMLVVVAVVILILGYICIKVVDPGNPRIGVMLLIIIMTASLVLLLILGVKTHILREMDGLKISNTDILNQLHALDTRVTILEHKLNPYVPTGCNVFKDHNNAIQLVFNQIAANFTSLDTRLTALESHDPIPGPTLPSPSPTPEPFCVDCPKRITELESQVKTLTAVAPQTCNDVGNWMEAAHTHRISRLNDQRANIEATLKKMYYDTDETFGKDSDLAISIKHCTSDSRITYKYSSSICEYRAILDKVDIELTQLNAIREYDTLLPAQLQRRIQDLKDKIAANHDELKTRIDRTESTVSDVTQVTHAPATVLVWRGKGADIPKGWRICDGEEGTINLYGKVIVGANGKGGPDNDYSLGETGGVSHTTLTIGNLPPHDHSNGEFKFILRSNDNGQWTSKETDYSNGEPDLVHKAAMQNVGNGDKFDNRQPYMALYYICRRPGY
jgi:hypothetical protein